MYVHFLKRVIDLVLSICAFPFWLIIFIPVAIAINLMMEDLFFIHQHVSVKDSRNLVCISFAQ